jgi:hypothetical protein
MLDGIQNKKTVRAEVTWERQPSSEFPMKRETVDVCGGNGNA